MTPGFRIRLKSWTNKRT